VKETTGGGQCAQLAVSTDGEGVASGTSPSGRHVFAMTSWVGSLPYESCDRCSIGQPRGNAVVSGVSSVALIGGEESG